MKNFKAYFLILLIFGISGCRKDKTEPMLFDNTNTITNNSVVPNDFLSASNYNELIVELQYMEGSKPGTAMVDHLKNLLQTRLNKPNGISIIMTPISSLGKPNYTLDDVKNIEKNNRTVNARDKVITAYILFADADYADNSSNSKVLGIAYGKSSMVVFEKTIHEFSGGLAQPPVSTLESTVTEHEFAHILGLVNNGTFMQLNHQDAVNGRHCNNKDCLMYYTAETSDIVANLLGGKILELDANCINDLRANGGK